MTREEAKGIVDNMKSFHSSGKTLSYEFRVEQLKKLKSAIKTHENQIMEALRKDLGKSFLESYSSEIGFVYEELNYTIKNLKKWMRPEKVKTPFIFFPSSSRIYSVPLGVALIISPWNYPFQLLFSPMVGAIAAGNCIVIKPSELAPEIAKVTSQIIAETFQTNYITSVLGDGATVVPLLIESARFDHIFFTGSIPVGKKIAESAAKQLIPITLELGGKSPCIVDEDADIDISAKRIVWGKFYNAGQTCVSPDYILVHRKIKQDLVNKISFYIEKFFGSDPAQSPDYGRIINSNHFDRVSSYIQSDKIILGGKTDREHLYIAPTLLDNVKMEDKIMQDEIFGPILPIIEYNTDQDIINTINQRPCPLSLYLFSNNKALQQKIIQEVPFGGGCINNTLVHLGNPSLPFGGVGTSGMGKYHGKYSFDTFSHKKGVLKTSFLMDPNLRYPPYKNKLSLIKRIMK